jgi:hypothetical protein
MVAPATTVFQVFLGRRVPPETLDFQAWMGCLDNVAHPDCQALLATLE